MDSFRWESIPDVEHANKTVLRHFHDAVEFAVIHKEALKVRVEFQPLDAVSFQPCKFFFRVGVIRMHGSEGNNALV